MSIKIQFVSTANLQGKQKGKMLRLLGRLRVTIKRIVRLFSSLVHNLMSLNDSKGIAIDEI